MYSFKNSKTAIRSEISKRDSNTKNDQIFIFYNLKRNISLGLFVANLHCIVDSRAARATIRA